MKTFQKIKTIKNDLLAKTLYDCIGSLAVIIAFAVYNAYLGARYNDAFAIGISIYYFVLCIIKTASLIVEKKLQPKTDEIQLVMRKRNYLISSIFIFILDICLIAPIILMAVKPKEVKFGIIPAIAMAAYSTYKIVVAIKNYIQSKKSKNLTIILLRQVNIIDAMVSILSLQHTLIMVNGGLTDAIKKLSLATSIAIIVFIIAFSIIAFLKNRKLI